MVNRGSDRWLVASGRGLRCLLSGGIHAVGFIEVVVALLFAMVSVAW